MACIQNQHMVQEILNSELTSDLIMFIMRHSLLIGNAGDSNDKDYNQIIGGLLNIDDFSKVK